LKLKHPAEEPRTSQHLWAERSARQAGDIFFYGFAGVDIDAGLGIVLANL
jgi:hypothetical protein